MGANEKPDATWTPGTGPVVSVRTALERIVGEPIWSTRNYPEPAQAYIMGRDISKLRTAVVDALLNAGVRVPPASTADERERMAWADYCREHGYLNTTTDAGADFSAGFQAGLAAGFGDVAAERARAEADVLSMIDERDHWQERLDTVIYSLASVEEVGEWSSGNSPDLELVDHISGKVQRLERERDTLQARIDAAVVIARESDQGDSFEPIYDALTVDQPAPTPEPSFQDRANRFEGMLRDVNDGYPTPEHKQHVAGCALELRGDVEGVHYTPCTCPTPEPPHLDPLTLAGAIFEQIMGFGWTDEYEGSREWDSAQDDARAFMASTPANPVVLVAPSGNTFSGWVGAEAFSNPISWITAGWRVQS